MYCRVLACDFDGTGAVDGRLSPEVAAALGAARQRGIIALLVTGRVLEDLEIAKVDPYAFDAIVAENGAVVSLAGGRRTILTGEPPPERLLVALREKGVPYHAGTVVVGTWDRHAAELLSLVRQLGLDQQLVFNRAALMLLPTGVNKAVGIARALEELGGSARNMIAFGDAENDQPMLAMSEIGVAARGAVPTVAAAADDRLSHANGEGIATYVRRLLEANCVMPTPARRHIALGTSTAGTPVVLPATGMNALISGDPRSGKSWLGGMVAERLLESGYRLWIVDPEGDHLALAERPQVLGFGHDLTLPKPATVCAMLRAKPLSVVLSLAALGPVAKVDYVDQMLDVLAVERERTGVPHWTVIDEAHYFFHEGSDRARRFDDRTGNTLFVTYRPSQLAAAVHDGVGAHLVVHTDVEEERYFMDGLLRSQDLGDVSASDALAALEPPLVGLLRRDRVPCWQVFTPGPRVTSHAHHARKYLDELLPPARGFHFEGTPAPVVARNVAQFCEALPRVPSASLLHHLLGGDFARWAQVTLGDERLAAGFRKLEQTARTSGRVSAAEIVKHVRDRYAV